MGKYKILYIVCVAVLSLFIRGSQSRSLNDDESEHISKKRGNIEHWITDCTCFPISVKGTPVSKSLPSNDDQERLVVYLYKNKKSGELTSYIPNWKKQSIFPDLTFDIGDILQTVVADGIISLFEFAKPERLEETTVANEHLEIPSVPTSDNQHKNGSGAPPQDLNSITIEIPSEELTASTISSDSDSKMTSGVTISPNLSLSVGNRLPLKGAITKPNQNLKPLKIQNQQTPVISDGVLAHLTPGKPGTAGQTIIINSPEHHSPIPNKIKNQELEPPLGQQKLEKLTVSTVSSDSDNRLITGVTVNPNLNLSLGNKQKPLKGTTVIRNQNLKPLGIQNQQTPVITDDLFAHLLPGKFGTEGQTIINSSTEQHSQIPNKIKKQKLNPPPGQQNQLMGDKSHVSNNLVNIVRYLPSEYKTPTFNNWFKEQVLNIRSQGPSMSNTINDHLLKPLLIKALYENGIRPSENGDLHDSNGNTLKMSNLKLRPILLGDPMEYEKLIASKKCVIPYDLPYLEAVLVTLIYPPRILAIIPLDSKKVFISTVRSGFPVNEENTLHINDNIYKDDVDSSTAGKILEDGGPIHSKNIESKNTYTYMSANNDPPVRLQRSKYDDQNSFHLTLPSGPRMSGQEIMYVNNFIPKASKKKCRHKHCQINTSFHSGSEKEEKTSLRRTFNVNKADEENDDNAFITEEFDGAQEKYEPLYMNYMTSNENLPLEENFESKYDSPNSLLQTRIPIDPEIYGGNPNLLWTRPISGREINYLDEESNIEGRKALEDFDDSQEIPEKIDEEDYENMLHIKIVGGNPATSSGTPVSSRGRSGLDF